jgi:Domain of unknown function (DUF4167)
MRQGQQNRRGRGRNNNNNNQNRKGQNPLTRSFESTGPDVKIRGTPAHIAEKYMTLARDAQSSGDPVLAENYLQHAEHYNRIIMAFREQQMAQGGGDMANGGGMGRPRPGGFGDPMMSDDYSDDDGDDMGGEVHQQQPSFSRSHEPQQMQPRPNEGQRFEDRGPRQGHDQHRQPHHRDRERHGGGGEQRGFSDRHDRPERQDRQERFQRPERVQRADPGLEGGGQQPARSDRSMVPHHEQPEFLRRPVRRPRREGNGAPGDEPAAAVSTPAVEDTGD